MKKVVFFGDSFLAALIWGQIEYSALREPADFFGAAGPYLRQDPLSVTKEGIRPLTQAVVDGFSYTGGDSFIDFAKYHTMVLVGYFARATPILECFNKGRVYCPPSYYERGHKFHLVTEEFYRQFLLQGSLFRAELAQRIQNSFKGRIIVVQQPFPSDAGPANSAFRRQLPKDIKMRVIQDYRDVTTEFWDSKGITFLPQPWGTISDACLTKHLYCEGSRRIVDETQHGANDFGHMNALYGNVVLTELARIL